MAADAGSGFGDDFDGGGIADAVVGGGGGVGAAAVAEWVLLGESENAVCAQWVADVLKQWPGQRCLRWR